MANKTITLVDNGDERYLIKADFTTLGRRYDNESEELTIIFPEFERESEHACTMVVTHDNQNVDRILVTDNTPVAITSRLSQYTSVTIGFVFTDSNGYIKGSEKKQFPFLPAQSPEDFVPVDPEIEDDLLFVIANALTKLGLSGNTLQGKNKAETVTTSVDLTAFKNTNIKFNGQVVEEVDANDFAAGIKMSLDTTNYKLTVNLVDGNDVVLSTQTVDLPSENAIVDASYDETTKKITFVLQSGNTFDVDVSSIVSGLVSDTRTIAGLRLNQNISASDLRTALNVEDGASSFNENNIIAGTNISVSKSGKNVTISATGIPSKTSDLINDGDGESQFATQADIGDGTITITENGETVATFSVNQTSNTTVNLTGGGGGGASSFDELSGSPYDNENLATALNSKVDKTTTIAGVDLQDNITKSELADALGISPDLNVENGIGDYSLQQKGDTTNHSKGASAIGDNSVAFGLGDDYLFDIAPMPDPQSLTNNKLIIYGTNVNSNWKDMVLEVRTSESEGESFVEGRYHIISTDTLSIAINRTTKIDDITSKYLHIKTQYAFADASSVKGEYNQAFGEASSVEGIVSKSTELATASHTEGYYNLSNQAYVHTEGKNNIGSGIASHVEGEYNTTFHNATHISGSHNQSSRNNQTVIGEYADTSRTDTLFVVGNGEDNARSSAIQVLKDGRTKIASSPLSEDDAIRMGDLKASTSSSTGYDGSFKSLKSYKDPISSHDVVTKTYGDNTYVPYKNERKKIFATGDTQVDNKYPNTVLAYSAGLNNGCIVQRDGMQIMVPSTPAENNHAASKEYVDTAISNAQTNLYKIQGSETVANLNSATKTEPMNGYVYNISTGGTLTNSDSSTVTAIVGDNVVFIWNSGSWFWDKLASDIDLSGYVKFTDYAGNSNTGVISAKTAYALSTSPTGELLAQTKTYAQYIPMSNSGFVGKGTLDNVISGKGFVERIEGSGAPTTSTACSRTGCIYLDTTNNKTYQCDAITEDTSTNPSTFTYTWNLVLKDTNISNLYGVGLDSGKLCTIGATDAEIDTRVHVYHSITPAHLNYAVKVALTDANHLTMTSAEQATAQSVIGAAPRGIARL